MPKSQIKVLEEQIEWHTEVSAELVKIPTAVMSEFTRGSLLGYHSKKVLELRKEILELQTDSVSTEEAQREYEHQMAIAHDHERMHGDPRKDWDSMQHRPSMITNEDGEPIGWG